MLHGDHGEDPLPPSPIWEGERALNRQGVAGQ